MQTVTLLLVALALCLRAGSVVAFTSPTLQHKSLQVVQRDSSDSSTKLFIFGQPKDDGKPGDYVCMVR